MAGDSSDLAELIVDYRKKGSERTKIKGVSETRNKLDIIKSAYKEWMSYLIIFPLALLGILYSTHFLSIIHYSEDLLNKIIPVSFGLYFMVCLIMSLFHLNPRFDHQWRKHFTLRTGKGEKNKAIFSSFSSKMFVIYDFDNIALDYEATKDVSKQLYKVWIKKEPHSSIYENQTVTRGMIMVDKNKIDPIWNAYFFFKKIPKSGELYVEWA